MRAVLTAFLIIIIFSSSNLFSQTGKITGYVKDSKTGEPLFGANIVLVGTVQGAAANADGYYVILNVAPGKYEVRASLIGYASSVVVDVKVAINQTTECNFELSDQSFQAGEVVVIAKRPVVEKDVAASTANINADDIKNLPVSSIASVVNIQAGIKGGDIRGGGADQTGYMLNGLTLRDDRTNKSFSGVSMTALEEIQVQTGGFNAEYGNIRSGLINMVSKEGKTDRYNISFIGRYRPAGMKSFEDNPGSLNSYYIRPFVDESVCWNGTSAWDPATQAMYPAFGGWNKYVKDVSEKLYQGLTPEAARRLFLWQHRKDFTITKPDYDVDMSITGPVPFISNQLGNLRFMMAYRASKSMYLIPLSTDNYNEYSFQAKVTSDVASGMKLTLDALVSGQEGTSSTQDGSPGICVTSEDIASLMNNENYLESKIFASDYWALASVKRKMFGGKFTHALSDKSFYEVKANVMITDYDKHPGSTRSQDRIYEIMPGYFTTMAPFGFETSVSTQGVGSQMRMGGGGMSTARDTSRLVTINARVDYENQFDKYNLLKAGVEFIYTDNDLKYGLVDYGVSQGTNVYNIFHTFPLKGALYVQDKIEYEGLIANVGVRFDYSNPNTDWYPIDDPYAAYFKKYQTVKEYNAILQSVKTQKVDAQLIVSPRLGISFPITESSKLFFNYGHFRQVPTPDNLLLVRKYASLNAVSRLSDPSMPLQKTVAYELGYEQSIMDEYLIRTAGYYKDVTNESRLVNYYNTDGSVNYYIQRPDLYEDNRGFEITLTRKRGDWVTGFVNYTYNINSSGNFNYDLYYENQSQQRDYVIKYMKEKALQSKPVATPYARADIEFFTPDKDFGPQLGGVEVLADWRLTILATWNSGSYFTWTGKNNSLPSYKNNMQWNDYYNVDLRISKNFVIGPVNVQLFADIYNALNLRYLQRSTTAYGWLQNDFDNYMQSLHLSKGKSDPAFGYYNIPGDDNPGDYRKSDVAYTPMTGTPSLSGISSPTAGMIYYETTTGRYVKSVNGAWVDVDAATLNKIKEDKSYINMPKESFFGFLNPRNIFFGIKFSVELK